MHLTYSGEASNAAGYPYVLGGWSGESHAKCLAFVGDGKNTHLVGNIARNATWSQVKSSNDWNMISMSGVEWYVVQDLWIENVEDAIQPETAGGEGVLYVRDVRTSWIRDDLIENDHGSDVVVEDCLLDEGHMFFSHRNSGRNHTCVVSYSLIGLLAKPDPRASGGKSTGGIWKDSGHTKVISTNSMYYVPQTAYRGTAQMDWPVGKFEGENNYLIWGGSGDYPCPVPSCVTVTKDKSIWETAKKNWLIRHSYETGTIQPSPIDEGRNTSALHFSPVWIGHAAAQTAEAGRLFVTDALGRRISLAINAPRAAGIRIIRLHDNNGTCSLAGAMQ